MNRSPWRLEEVDGGDEQYPVESRFAVRHTPPDEQDPRGVVEGWMNNRRWRGAHGGVVEQDPVVSRAG